MIVLQGLPKLELEMRKTLPQVIVLLVLFTVLATDVSVCGVEPDFSQSPSTIPEEYSTAASVCAFDGYTLFAPMRSQITYLIDNSEEVLHTWESDYRPALAAYLLENGTLLRTAFPGLPANSSFQAGGGAGGLVQKIDWNGTVIWEFEYSDSQHLLHHDIEPLPNGNVLMIAWEHKTTEEAINAGRNPGLLIDEELWPDHIIEVEPTGATGGNVVWEWHVWDHLIQDYNSTSENYGIVANHPELVDINFVGQRADADWNHLNSVDYNEEFDQILLSVNKFAEIWVIDHSTTTEEAASHTGGNSGKGGDILYRWGNPQTYRAGGASDQKFFKQHDAQWIGSGLPGEGDILVFNNGANRPDGSYSSIDEIVPPVYGNGSYFLAPASAFEPEEQTWIYTAENPPDFYSQGVSGAQRIPNGNTLICSGGNGIFFEVTMQKQIVWEYVNPYPVEWMNNVFKIRRYGRNYPGLLDLLRLNDVAITNLTCDKTIVIRGEEVTIEATVENQGSYNETFNVTLCATPTINYTFTNITLTSGNCTTVSFTWNTTDFAYGNHTVSALASPVPEETDISDNTLADTYIIVTIAGDVDGDNDVDIFDIVAIASVYGISKPHPLYDPNCDIDNDGDIDIFDIVAATGNYGQEV